jgi:hypothetical protein
MAEEWSPLIIVSWGVFGLACVSYYLFYAVSACRHRIFLWSRLCCRHQKARAAQSKYEKQLSLSIMLSTGGAWIAHMLRMKNSETHSAQGIRNTLMSCTVLAGFAFNSGLSSLQKIHTEGMGNGLTPQQASDLAVGGFLFLSFLHFMVVLRSGKFYPCSISSALSLGSFLLNCPAASYFCRGTLDVSDGLRDRH